MYQTRRTIPALRHVLLAALAVAGCEDHASKLQASPAQGGAAQSQSQSTRASAVGSDSCDLCAKWREHWCALQVSALFEFKSEIPRSADGGFYVNGKNVADRAMWCLALKHAGAVSYGYARGMTSAGTWLLPDPDQAKAFPVVDLAIALDKAADACEPEHAAETVLKMDALISEYTDKLAKNCDVTR